MSMKFLTVYSVEPIGPRTFATAFPLASVLNPRLTLSEWSELCLPARGRSTDPESANDGERITVVMNADRYVKAICFHALRDHSQLGRLLDIPLLVIASVADGDGVAVALLDFLRFERDRHGCAGIRFWVIDEQTWNRRFDPAYIQATDSGYFMAAPVSGGEASVGQFAHSIDHRFLIGRFSR